MRRASRPLLLLHPDSDFRNQVLQAGSDFAFWSVSEWEPLRDAIRGAPPTVVVVVDPYVGGTGGRLAPQLTELLQEFPWAGVVAAFRPRPGSEEDVQALAGLGISEIVLIGVEDTPQAIRRILRQAQGRYLKQLLKRILPSYVSGKGRVILMASAEAISAGGHTPDLARALSVATKTLARWCEKSYLPPPRRLLAWIRVLLASELLDDRARTVSSVARACGYTSDTALRRALIDFAGMGPTDLREAGAFDTASRAFLAELQRLREKGRLRRRRSRARSDAAPG
ncbi:MAG TPA: helix-turn-helix domain-containing protein [Longimicrobiaceae bacterium]|nr:helix-turn-helix domain-containing protein [Longimicrobiaceae bacterium]